jgi:hypothetical protein
VWCSVVQCGLGVHIHIYIYICVCVSLSQAGEYKRGMCFGDLHTDKEVKEASKQLENFIRVLHGVRKREGGCYDVCVCEREGVQWCVFVSE